MKVNLRKFRGKWFVSVGNNGYTTTPSFASFLEEVKPDVVYLEETPNEPWFRVDVEKGERDFTMTFTNLSTDEKSSVTQCYKLEDLNLPTQFYINRGNSRERL